MPKYAPDSTSEKDGWILSGPEILSIRSREYHYNAWSSTLLDPYMQPFWRYVVVCVPTSVAPSTLSACGLFCNIIATAVTIYFAPTATEELPAWVSLINAVSIFLYQTFDGIDGKQCFRTQDSEVEEYADHAVDSISVVLNAVLLAAAMRLGDSPIELGANLLLALSAFFAAHWAAQRTHSLVFGHVDVTEAQFGMMAIHIASALGGSSMWDHQIVQTPSMTIRVRTATSLVSGVILLSSTVASLLVALGIQETPLESHGIRIPRKALSLWPMLAYGIITTGAFSSINSGLLTSLTIPTMLVIGLAIGKAGTQMILQKLTMRAKPTLDISILAPWALSQLQDYCGPQSATFHTAAWTLVGLQAIDVVTFHLLATEDLKRARDIHRFSVKNREGKAKLVSTGFYVAGSNVQDVQKQWRAFEADEPRARAAYCLRD